MKGSRGEGNAVFDLSEAPSGLVLQPWILARLPHMAFEACGMTWDLYQASFWPWVASSRSSSQAKSRRLPRCSSASIPLDELETISTHDQVLGGNSGQIFLGCRFPANAAYRSNIEKCGIKAARALLDKGVLGRFGIDFISVKEGNDWRHMAIEINLRKGGTTHPFLMLQFLTDGQYDSATGQFLTPGDARDPTTRPTILSPNDIEVLAQTI